MASRRKSTGFHLAAIAVALALALTACESGRTADLQNPAATSAISPETETAAQTEPEKLNADYMAKVVKTNPNIDPPPGSSVITSGAVEITPELIKQLRRRIDITHKAGVDAPGAIGEFIKANPNFLYDQSGRVTFSRGDNTVDDGGEHALLLPWGGTPETYMINRERLAAFVEHYKAGVPDRVAVISPGSQLPVWVEVFTYAGNGTAYTVESYSTDSEKPRTAQVDPLVETDREWLMLNLPNWKSRYPKYGYEPEPLAGSGREVGQAEAQMAIKAYLKAKYPETEHVVSLREQKTINGKRCYVFEAVDTGDSFSNETLAVSTNLDHLYEIEQESGQWMLHARPKSAPIKAEV